MFSDARNDPQLDVWLTNTRTVIIVEEISRLAETGPENPKINVDANNVDEQSDLSLNVSQPSTREEAVGIDVLKMTVEPGGYFDMNITHAEDPDVVGADPYTPGGDREVVQHVQLTHRNIPNGELNATGLVYRVKKSALADGVADDQITFRRYANGTWNEHTANLVGDTNTHYVYTVETPGFSQFLVTAPTDPPEDPQDPEEPDQPSTGGSGGGGGGGSPPASFTVSDASVATTQLTAGDTLDVTATIENTGGTVGFYTARLDLNGTQIASGRVAVGPGSEVTVDFTPTVDSPGIYNVTVGSRVVETVQVNSGTEDTGNVSQPDEDTGDQTGGSTNSGDSSDGTGGSTGDASTGADRGDGPASGNNVDSIGATDGQATATDAAGGTVSDESGVRALDASLIALLFAGVFILLLIIWRRRDEEDDEEAEQDT